MSDNNRNNQNTNENYSWQGLTGFHRAVPILLGTLAIILFAGFSTKGTVLAVVASVLPGLFSYGAYAIPVLLLIHAFFYAEDLGKGRIKSRIIFSVITILLISVVEYGIYHWSDWKTDDFTPGKSYTSNSSGGFIGTVLAWLIVKAIGPIGLIIVAVLLLPV